MSETRDEVVGEPVDEYGEPQVIEPAAAPDVESTGDPAVDAVVASLRGLDELPVSEHVAVFERAHESLRQILSGAGEPVREPVETGAPGRG
jgi:hypothetical protein